MNKLVEPYASDFRQLIKRGAGTLDIHDRTSGKYAEEIEAFDELIDREVGRVEVHLNSFCKTLKAAGIKGSRALDLGCGTGATTVAMALDKTLGFSELIGADPNGLSLDAARARMQSHGLKTSELDFLKIEAGKPLPFEDGHFDVVTCVSVLEYIDHLDHRRAIIQEMIRVTKAAGSIVLITPNPYRLRSYHTDEWFGDFRRLEGHPWSSTRSQLASFMQPSCNVRFLGKENLTVGLEKRLGQSGKILGNFLPEQVSFLLPWIKLVATKK